MTKKILLLETSGRVGRVAVAAPHAILHERRLDETRRHARDLAPATQALLREAGWRPRDVDAVFVSLGPGSYTGLRVGITSAKAFAYAIGCDLVGVETFRAIALQAAHSGLGYEIVDVLSDAQQNNLYQQRLTFDASGWPLPAIPPGVLSVEEWLGQIDPSVAVSGPCLTAHLVKIPNEVQRIPPTLWDPQPASILHLGMRRWSNGERDNVLGMEPLYLRPSSAEEKWRALGR